MIIIQAPDLHCLRADIVPDFQFGHAILLIVKSIMLAVVLRVTHAHGEEEIKALKDKSELICFLDRGGHNAYMFSNIKNICLRHKIQLF